MIPFVIIADMRTGSTLLHSSLDAHPEVRCLGELLHTSVLPDNVPPGIDPRLRGEMCGRDLVARAFDVKAVKAAGFRAMIFLPSEEQARWQDAWNALAANKDLRVIYLTRRDQLAQYASLLVARQTGAYHPSADDPVLQPNARPRIHVDAAEFRRWRRERDELFDVRRARLEGKPSLEIDYERLTNDWDGTIGAAQEFLGVARIALGQVKQKQERRPLSEVIVNYDQLAEADGVLSAAAGAKDQVSFVDFRRRRPIAN